MASSLLAVGVKSVAGAQSDTAAIVNRLPSLRTNVSTAERVISLGVGGGLMCLGFNGRGPGLLSTLAGGYLLYRAASGNCPLYQAVNVSTSESTAPNTSVTAGHGEAVEATITVRKPVADVYRFWRDFENLPRFMTHLLDVNTSTDGTSHWVARGPLGLRVEWDAKIVTDTANETISWKSLDGSDVDNAGSVHFRALPGDRETEVRVRLKYDPPGGKFGSLVAKIVGLSPERQIQEDMRRLKEIMESGEGRNVRPSEPAKQRAGANGPAVKAF
jgi:uncharacterized membrane protein